MPCVAFETNRTSSERFAYLAFNTLKRGSSPNSGIPSPLEQRFHISSFADVIHTQPSDVGKASFGSPSRFAVPHFSGNRPFIQKSVRK
jgi:hypothetical protein